MSYPITIDLNFKVKINNDFNAFFSKITRYKNLEQQSRLELELSNFKWIIPL